MSYDGNNRLILAQDNLEQKFNSAYAYNESNAVSGVSCHSSDNLHFEESYQYDQIGNLIHLSSPQFQLNLTYNNNSLATVDAGQGNHSWATEDGEAGSLTHITSDDGESIALHQPDINELTISSTGTVNANIKYSTTLLTGKKTGLTIEITSNNVESGKGKNDAVEYVLDAYGRVIQSGSTLIAREPYTGNITSITNGGISETRTYNSWEHLTSQKVTYNGQTYYEASYQYDGLQRIKTVSENVLGTINNYEFTYSQGGQLQTVRKNSIVVEQYSYDTQGNRTSSIANGITYTFLYNNNRLEEYSWLESGKTKKKEFTYNNSGQLLGSVNKTVTGTSAQITSNRSFIYNVSGNLNKVSWASQYQDYKHDTDDRRIATYANGAIKSKLVYGLGNSPVSELNEYDRIVNTFVYADNSTPVLIRKGSVDYYIISDIRGSVRMVVKSSTGEIRQQLSYDAFGKVTQDTNPGYTPFGYAGGLYDYRTDLVRFGARDYSAEVGRWTAEDPIGFWSGDVNFYAYVANDPINFVDPSGLSKSPCSTLGPNLDDLIRDAQKLYPGKAGKTEWHHIEPKYLGGAFDGPLSPLDAAYHQVITNEFRRLHSYGKGKISNCDDRKKIMKQVYEKLPLPPGYTY